MQDDDVAAVRLRLSSRHPVFDICDLFAEADMYGFGKCVYPKDKAPPIPLHPYCMCRLEEVFKWEVDISKQKNNVKQAGDKWLNGLSDENRRLVLGIEGNAMWKDGENWQKYMRNWKGLAEPETRLKNVTKDVKMNKVTRRNDNIGSFAHLEIPMQKREVLKIAREYGFDTAGITYKIQRDEKLLKMPFMGSAAPNPIGRVDLYPKAFTNKTELIKTLIHEKSHIKQFKKYVQDNRERMEDVAERYEKFWFAVLRRRAKR